MSYRRIIGIGETVLDVIFRNDQPLAAVPGGSAFNAMVSLGRSIGKKRDDIPILMITETGDDHIGDIVVKFMRDNNISTDAVTRNKGTQTHLSMAFLDENNDAQYEFYKDYANASLKADKVANVEFREGDIVLFGSFFAINPVLRQYTRKLLTAAHDAGAILYYDLNFRKTHIKDIPEVMDNIVENFQLATIVRGSTEDFGYLFGTSVPQEIYEIHMRKHCNLFICTDSCRPIALFTPEISAQYPVEQIKTVSTIGAGDNFNAGIVYGIIQQNLSKTDLSVIGETTWSNLIASGQSFSKKVCQSIFNYIEL